MVCGGKPRAWRQVPRVNPMLNRICLKLRGVKVRKEPMPTHRRRFRIEEAYIGGDVPMPVVADGEVGPMHREIMNELRAIRAQMAGGGGAGRSAAAETLD